MIRSILFSILLITPLFIGCTQPSEQEENLSDDDLCGEGCIDCRVNGCAYCDTGYTQYPNPQCTRCIANCDRCIEATKCSDEGCTPGYGSANNGVTCEKCDDNCEVCGYSGSVNNCDKCNDGYTLTRDLKCIPCEVENCSFCQFNTPTICAYCASGFSTTDNGKTCQPS